MIVKIEVFHRRHLAISEDFVKAFTSKDNLVHNSIDYNAT